MEATLAPASVLMEATLAPAVRPKAGSMDLMELRKALLRNPERCRKLFRNGEGDGKTVLVVVRETILLRLVPLACVPELSKSALLSLWV